jgi:hypothetical protein
MVAGKGVTVACVSRPGVVGLGMMGAPAVRRDHVLCFLIVLLMLGTGCLEPLSTSLSPLPSPQPWSVALQDENSRIGSDDWDSGLFAGDDSSVTGFAVPFSGTPGDTIRVFVSARLPKVSVSLYRLGWYGGTGARLVTSHSDLAGSPQPRCSESVPGPAICNWILTDTLQTGTSWMPGVYLVKFADSVGHARSYPLVLRASETRGFVVVLPFSTYQAYNAWGGASLYDSPGAPRASAVSFARPIAGAEFRRSFLTLDYILIRWLEETGYNVSYLTDYDLGTEPGVGMDAIGWLFAGHSEYWTWQLRTRVEEARTEGVNLGFLGGNDVYWNSRYETAVVGGATVPVLVCYKSADRDPEGLIRGQSTARFRDYPNDAPENALVGVMSATGLNVKDWPKALVVYNGKDPLFNGTGLQSGTTVPGILGWEGDRIVDNGLTPLAIRVLFQSQYVPVQPAGATDILQGTFYTWAPSGAKVFAAGDVGFQWGLSTYAGKNAIPSLQVFLKNLLTEFIGERSNR